MSEKQELEALLGRIRRTLADVAENTTGSTSMPLLVTRRRLLVVNIAANQIVKNIDQALGDRDKESDENYH